MNTSPKTQNFIVNGINIAALSWGNPKGLPIIALHGWLDNAASFSLLAPELAEYHLIAIDFPGHGHSDHLPPSHIYHFTDAIPTVTQIADQCGFEQFSLLGHSMGAAVATLVAGVLSHRIRAVALIEGLGPMSAPANSAALQYRQYLEKLPSLRPPKLHPTFAAAVQARTASGMLSETLATRLAERGTQTEPNGVRWRHDPRLLIPTALHLTEPQILDFLTAITAPCLLLMGKNGYRYDRDLIDTRMQTINNLTTHTLPGGHHLHMEYPEQAGVLIREFLTKM